MTKPRKEGKSPTKASKRTRARASTTAQLSNFGERPSHGRSIGVALWRQIAEDLEADIETGRLAAGSRLPTENELAHRFGVNRHTLRRALGDLSYKGLVEATPGRGTFVCGPRLAYPIGQSTRFSEVIAESGREPGGHLLGHRQTVVPDGIRDWLQLPEGAEAVELEHIRAANSTPICVATTWFPAERFAGIAEAYAETGTITQALAKFGVKAYRRKRTLISSRAANSSERDALRLERGASVLVIDAINVDDQDVPIQVGHSRFAAERVQLVVDS